MARPSPGTVMGGLALIISLGGVAVAADQGAKGIPNANGVISSCVDLQTGAIQIIDEESGQSCSGTQLLRWNQQGVQGPAGATGATGAAGKAGSRGPAGADGGGPGYRRVFGEDNISNNPAQSKILGSFVLPKGSWHITANLELFASTQYAIYAFCELNVGGEGNIDEGSIAFQARTENGAITTQRFPMAGHATINVSRSVIVRCRWTNDGDGRIRSVFRNPRLFRNSLRLYATPVDRWIAG